ncbi:substrate-binding periplasmic protein [Aquitalea magnusonii]|jgi:polar amino acid transport system substrate-binding protein|nr:transporter substrate-binding domain-containing protein [Aquitalea magnusonii]
MDAFYTSWPAYRGQVCDRPQAAAVAVLACGVGQGLISLKPSPTATMHLRLSFRLALLLSLPAHAAGLTAYTEHVPPLTYQQDGQIRGYASELLTTMAGKAGLTLRQQLLPWPRAYVTVLNTPDSVLYSTVRTPEREQQFRWLGPIGKRRVYLYRLAVRNDIQLTTPGQLQQWRIGAVRGSASQTQLQQLGLRPGIEQDNAPDDASNLAKLRLGRVDMIAMLDWAMYWQLQQAGISSQQIRPVALLDGQEQYWFALNRQTAASTITRLQNALRGLEHSGFVAQLQQKYLGPDKQTAALPDFSQQFQSARWRPLQRHR